MIPRMTTVGTLKNYRYDLNRSNNTMSKAMNTVMTGRAFNSYAEDPAIATRCFQLRRSYQRAASQLTVNDSLYRKYNQAWSALEEGSQDIYSISNDPVFGSLIRGLNGADASGRNALGQSLEAKAKNLVQIMNGRHGENYVFSGADTLNVPFTWEPRENPDYIDPAIAQAKLDEEAANPGTLTPEEVEKYQGAFQYVAAGGKLTNNVEEAETVAKVNTDPNIDFTQPSAVGNEWYLDADGAVTTDPNLSQISYEANPDYKPYLNGKGQPTADESEAKLVNNPNFNMTVSELRDRKGYLHYITEKQTPIELRKDGDAAAYQEAIDNLGKTIKNRDPDTGNMHIVSYRESGKDENGDPIYTKYEYVQVLSTPVHLDDNDLHGALQADRELLTEKGEFMDTSIIDGTNEDALSCDEKARSKRGIPYFQKSLDLLANQLANAINGANQGYRYDDQGNYIGLVMGEDGEPMVDEDTGRVIGMPVSIPYQKLEENGAPMVDDNGNAVMGEYKLNKDTKWDKPEVWDALPDEVKTALEATGKTGSEAVKAYLSQPQTHQVQKTDQDGKPMFDQNGDPIMEEVPYTDEDGNPITMGIFEGGVLISNHNNGDDTTNITAGNISISNSWSKNAVSIIRSFECGPGESEPASGDSKNILHMQNLFHTKMDYVPSDLFSTRDATDDSMFNGTFSEMWENMGGILGNDQDVTNNSLTTSYKSTLQIDTNRDSVSSVDFNDEAMNLMMYAKSYNAACRLMTTIDTVLDKLINNTGVTT